MVVETNGRAMVRHEEPTQAMTTAAWNAEQTNVVKTLICPGASDAELALFAQVCKQTGLSPFARQIYGLMRWDGRAQREVLSIQTSIDGFRLAAQRSGEYAGQVGPQWCGEDGVWRDVWLSSDPPAAARVGVLRRGWTQPTYGIATWAEYCQRNKDGSPSNMWKRMPATMLAKCSEALALRKVFPAELSGLYSREEMAQADNPPPTIQEAIAATANVVEGAAVEHTQPRWLTQFDEQWAKGTARAEEIGATIPPRDARDKATAILTLRTLHQNIRLREREASTQDGGEADGRVRDAALLTGAPSEERGQLVADIRELIERANGQGADFAVPEDLADLDDAALETLHDSLLNALEAHAATAGAGD